MHEPYGVLLEDLTWQEAAQVLTESSVVVIPIGAASKQHGPHLKLKNDLLIADYLKLRLLQREPVVVAPTIGYHHYPSFAEYAGSISLRAETACNVLIDICQSLRAFGPRRFYALNTGVSTITALEPAAESLRGDGILLTFTRLEEARAAVSADVITQAGGGHADEIETSMMLYIAPDTVDMTKAVDDYDASGRPGLSPNPDSGKTYSPSGVWGEATRATREKGALLVEAMVDALAHDVRQLRDTPWP